MGAAPPYPLTIIIMGLCGKKARAVGREWESMCWLAEREQS